MEQGAKYMEQHFQSIITAGRINQNGNSAKSEPHLQGTVKQ
jgi:hypothetical protein